MSISTRNQQIAQWGVERLNQSVEGTEISLDVKAWFQSLGISLLANEEMFVEWGNRYSLTLEQVRQVAELEMPTPSWFMEPDHPLQYAVPGLYVSFLLSSGLYTITTVIETRTIKKGDLTLLGIDGMGKGWYNPEGLRTTKEGQIFQGSAYAGRIFPVNDALLTLIERQALLKEITGYHQAYFQEGGTLHTTSIEALRQIAELLKRRESTPSECPTQPDET